MAKHQYMGDLAFMGARVDADIRGNVTSMGAEVFGDVYGNVTGMNCVIHGDVHGNVTGMGAKIDGKVTGDVSGLDCIVTGWVEGGITGMNFSFGLPDPPSSLPLNQNFIGPGEFNRAEGIVDYDNILLGGAPFTNGEINQSQGPASFMMQYHRAGDANRFNSISIDNGRIAVDGITLTPEEVAEGARRSQGRQFEGGGDINGISNELLRELIARRVNTVHHHHQAKLVDQDFPKEPDAAWLDDSKEEEYNCKICYDFVALWSITCKNGINHAKALCYNCAKKFAEMELGDAKCPWCGDSQIIALGKDVNN